MSPGTDEPSIPDTQELTGEERDRFVEQLLQTTDLSRITDYIREKGYNLVETMVQRDIHSEYSFDIYRVSLRYLDKDEIAVATWTGLDPYLVEAGEISYETARDEIDFDEQTGDSSINTENAFPVIVGFLKNGDVGLSLTPNGIEENEADWKGLAKTAKNADWEPPTD